jgi:hypothetical protein
MPTDPRMLAFVGMGFLNNAVPFGLIVWDRPDRKRARLDPERDDALSRLPLPIS